MTPSDQDLRDIIRHMDQLVAGRLRQYLGGVNLFNYEGTICDQLALRYMQHSGVEGRVHVFCSERPCMSTELRRTTRAHAGEHGLGLISFDKDCVLKPDRTGFLSTECSGVGAHIKSFLQGKQGVLIVAALLGEDARDGFAGMNDFFKTFAVEERCYVGNHDVQHDWHTLFLFEGCRPIDLVVAYTYHHGRLPATHDIPLCYLHCYHERQLIQIIELIETHGAAILSAVGRLRPAASS